MSVGCECALFETEPSRPTEPRFYVGGYVDITFRDPLRSGSPDPLIALAVAILQRVRPSDEYHTAFTMHVERLRAFFGHLDRYGLMVKPAGYGQSGAEAWAAFNHAASATASALRALPTI